MSVHSLSHVLHPNHLLRSMLEKKPEVGRPESLRQIHNPHRVSDDWTCAVYHPPNEQHHPSLAKKIQIPGAGWLSVWISAIDTHTQRQRKHIRVCCSAPDLAGHNNVPNKMLESTTLPNWRTDTIRRGRDDKQLGYPLPYTQLPNAHNNDRAITQPKDVDVRPATNDTHQRLELGERELLWQVGGWMAGPLICCLKSKTAGKLRHWSLQSTEKTPRDPKTAVNRTSLYTRTQCNFFEKEDGLADCKVSVPAATTIYCILTLQARIYALEFLAHRNLGTNAMAQWKTTLMALVNVAMPKFP